MEASDTFYLKRQTLQLAINYIDSFLAKSPDFSLDRYQLVGITSLLIACKHEEIYFPNITDFRDITDGKCSLKDIFDMEIEILTKL